MMPSQKKSVAKSASKRKRFLKKKKKREEEGESGDQKVKGMGDPGRAACLPSPCLPGVWCLFTRATVPS